MKLVLFYGPTEPASYSRTMRAFRPIALLIASLAATPAMPQDTPSVRLQRTAMAKLANLEGIWTGPATIVRRGSPTVQFIETMRSQFKLDGLLLVVEEANQDQHGEIVYRSFTTISYDPATRQYRHRTHRDGKYHDTELTAVQDGFSWRYSTGPAHIVNTMQLTPSGDWAETTESISTQRPPIKIVDMLLKRRH